MSLINEALQRARVEAARREAAESGVPPAALPIHVPERRWPWLATLLGFAAGIALVAAIAIGLWLRGTGPRNPDAGEPGPSPTAAARAEVSAADPLSPAEAIVGEEETPPAPALATGAPAAEPAHQGLPRRPDALDRAPLAAPAAAATGAVEAPAETVAAGPPAVPTYLREAEPPGGGRLKLDFIVWSQSWPFAQINGELISPGQRVDGYDLLTVERERVQLRGPESTFWIRVR